MRFRLFTQFPIECESAVWKWKIFCLFYFLGGCWWVVKRYFVINEKSFVVINDIIHISILFLCTILSYFWASLISSPISPYSISLDIVVRPSSQIFNPLTAFFAPFFYIFAVLKLFLYTTNEKWFPCNDDCYHEEQWIFDFPLSLF